MITGAFIISVIIVLIIYILYYSVTQLKKHASIDKLPGPSSLELLSMAFHNKSAYDKYYYMVNLPKNYGPLLKLWIKPFNPIVMVADVEIMNKIMSSKSHLRKTKTYDMMKPVMKEAIGTTSKVELWKSARKACNVVFQPANTTKFLPLIKKHTDRFFETLIKHLDVVVDIQPLLHLYALDLLFEFATKRDKNFLDKEDVEYLNAVRDIFRILAERMYSALLQNDTLFRLSKYFKSWHKACYVMNKMTYDVVKSEEAVRKHAIRENPTQHIIDVLFANDLQLDMSSLNDHIKTFIIAGNDTTAQILCFVLYELSKHPKMQQKLFEEVLSLVDQDGEITNDALKQMIYLEAVVNETLRLHTVVPFVERKLGSCEEIDGIHYPEGTRFIFSIVGIHGSSKYFENPDEFNPDRFMPENAHLHAKQSLVSFSTGPRNCIGKLFAMLALKYFTARAIQEFEIFPDTGHVLKVIGEFVLTSKTGIPVIIKKRCK